ncbi:hypothetical protein BDV95DRAFT_612699 [Massariosphaeria phaeospora]|uniref:Uncharacterized protein n=1 Tax=Massariosphaeria phaeospora TaxID=100035 RepID=A0A7C8M4A3_9PLEO|nr:hypothetical protein BDV95DRAFT_612699 [Massariosphaeria phaeospora]
MSPLELDPLKMSPPDIFVSPPSPTTSAPPSPALPPTSASATDLIVEESHASTSSNCITSPILQVPNHDPITTTLTPLELSILLPTLHIYILPHHPSIALLPASTTSHTGLLTALRWRETELHDPTSEIPITVPGLIQMYQSLAFLGLPPSSRELLALNAQITAEMRTGLCLAEYKAIWALRALPFTERFIGLLLRGLVDVHRRLSRAANREGLTEALRWDEGLREEVEEWVAVLRWVEGEDGLEEKVNDMLVMIEREEKWAGRLGRGKSAVEGRKSALETVYE